MDCTDKKMATRVATFGALKMTELGYSFEAFGAGGIVRRKDGFGYSVCLPVGGAQGVSGNCTCKFFEANREFGTCKHIVWAGWQAKAEAAEIARREEEWQIAEDAARFMEGCRAERGQ